MERKKLRVAVVKFSSCDGCQLTLLDAEDELLAIADAVDLVHFAEASSHLEPGPYDVALVEGSITTPADVRRIQELRQQTQTLIAIGACATSGGIQALRNFADHAELLRAVYARPEYLDTLATSTPLRQHVRVDLELRGCPVAKGQLLEVLAAVLAGRGPHIVRESVCAECKRRGVVCVAVACGETCLGPITQAGCGALCPAYARGCFGCFGPATQANTTAWAKAAVDRGVAPARVGQLLHMFHGAGPAHPNICR